MHAGVAEKDVLSWSSNSSDQALVHSFFLVLLSGQPRKALSPNVEQLWLWTLHASTSHSWNTHYSRAFPPPSSFPARD
ncbi:hypothetical protein ARMA_1939 [Ardenticatena maritima]|uniref:Uncharacterized protein n=1 Tax=Ardenticatena maritima TaxID=872965 RepID=A0A0M8KAA9_9CHLR|nr:hypothetical protein ARMA_1939 [Ardenticatena maritima]